MIRKLEQYQPPQTILHKTLVFIEKAAVQVMMPNAGKWLLPEYNDDQKPVQFKQKVTQKPIRQQIHKNQIWISDVIYMIGMRYSLRQPNGMYLSTQMPRDLGCSRDLLSANVDGTPKSYEFDRRER